MHHFSKSARLKAKRKHKITWRDIGANCEYVSYDLLKDHEGTRIQIMSQSNTWAKLISWILSIMHVLLALFIGYLISALISAGPAINPWIFVFAATSKLFAVAFTEEKKATRKRRIYSAMALMSLSPLLIGLTTFEIVTGLSILMLYSLYPLFNGKAPFDVIHHMLRYVLIFILGYGSQAVFNETPLLAILAIALFSLAGELIAGLKNNSDTSKNFASLLGIKRSLIVIVLSIFIASLIAAFVLNDLFEFPIQINGTFIPFYVIPALAMDLYITEPLMKALSGKHVDPLHLMRKKELTAILIASLIALVVFQTGRISVTTAVNSRNYSFDANIRTFIAGPHDWDEPWIVFNYVNENNFYYAILHKDGILELSLKMNGTIYHESSLKTQLTPFQWLNFHISLNETTVAVELNGEYQISTTRDLASDHSSIIISPSILHPQTGMWIFSIYSININP